MFEELDHEYMDPVKVAILPPGGSTDFADVTHVVPGIHPMIGIKTSPVPLHSKPFADATLTPAGDDGLEVGIKCLAMATVEVMTKPEVLKEIKDEFEAKRIK